MLSTRRRALALGAALLSAGCLGTGQRTPGAERPDTGDTATSPPTEAGTTHPERTAQSTTDRCVGGVNVRTTAFDPASDLPHTLGSTERAIVDEAVASGHVDDTTYAQPVLESDMFVAHGERFYRTNSTVVQVEDVPAFSMDVHWERGQTAPAAATLVSFETLPRVDRDALRAAVLHPTHEGLPQQGLSISEYPAPYPDADASQLIGGRTWVRWRDRTFRVRVAGTSETTQERRTVRYAVEPVADTPEAFRQYVAAQYLVVLDDLPAPQRELLEDALAGGYEECRPTSAALSGLRERLSGTERLPDPHEDSWYVAFDGRRFRLAIAEWVH